MPSHIVVAALVGLLVACGDGDGDDVDAGDARADTASDTGTTADTSPGDTSVTADAGGDTAVTPTMCMPLISISSATGVRPEMSTPLGTSRLFWRIQLAPGFTVTELGVALAAMNADAQITLALYRLADDAAIPSGEPLVTATFSPAADVTRPGDVMVPIVAYEVDAAEQWLAVALWSDAGSTETLLALGYSDANPAQTTNLDMMGSVTAAPGHRLFFLGCPAP